MNSLKTLGREVTMSTSHFFFKNKFIYLFIFGCVGSSLLRPGFLQLQRSGATLHCSAWTYCGGFSCCGARALGARASVVVACGLSSCGSRAQLLRGMWDLPRPGLEPVSPALAGRFLTTTPPGKSPLHIFKDQTGSLYGGLVQIFDNEDNNGWDQNLFWRCNA